MAFFIHSIASSLVPNILNVFFLKNSLSILALLLHISEKETMANTLRLSTLFKFILISGLMLCPCSLIEIYPNGF